MEAGIDGRTAAPETSAQIRNTLGLLPVIALSAALTSPAYAQTATPAPGAADGDVVLQQINVEGKGGEGTSNTNEATTGLKRVPTKIQDTPQVINVITEEQIQQRAVTNLSELITRVPGVTMSAGEGGGGGMGGDSFNIRGLTAVGNVFVDGIRDSGIASRDPFNMEQVEIFKGGAGSTLGRGGGGGSINMTSKTAKDHFFADIYTTVGTDNYYRGAIDVNVPVTPEVAFRLNAVGLSRDFAERDHVFQKRWGIAPTVTFGMTSDTKLTLSYIHQEDWGRPDNGVPRWGVPVLPNNVGVLEPVTKHGVRRQNYYGYLEDREEYELDRFTATFEHEFTPDVSFTNTFRVGSYWHDRFVTTMPAGNIYDAVTCANPTDPTCTINPGQSTRGMDGTTYQNQATLNANFDTGTLSHQTSLGLDISRENLTHYNNSVTPSSRPALDLNNPALGSHGQTRIKNPRFDHKVDTVGVTAYDRVHLGNGFYVIGNGRVERYKVNSVDNAPTSPTAPTQSSYGDTLFSWLGAIEYKPWENHTYYAAASSTELPRSPTTGYTGLISVDSVKPQKTVTYELGGKWNLLDERLGLGASTFFTKLSDEVTEDASGNQTVNEDTRHIKGIELSVTGNVTNDLTVTAGYSWLYGRIKSGDAAGYAVGLMPTHSGFIWADYQVNEKFRVGAGVNYISNRFTGDYHPDTRLGVPNATNPSGNSSGRLPGHVTVDVSANYQFNERFGLQFNAINIFNEETFEKSHGARHMVPGQGRTFLLTAKTSF
ncbi:TonB-dependent receptor [Aquamicrobium ahrensii]|uniref:Catecholate siderophore receptor n=1 Tax=Aquamicrobium ahrensii TaxID=469551 RepID=A0ABV2KLC9_9HYPH